MKQKNLFFTIFVAMIVVASLSMFGCTREESINPEDNLPGVVPDPTPKDPPLDNDIDLDINIGDGMIKANDAGATEENIGSLIDANNEFGFNIYKRFEEENDNNGNIFFSPYSVTSAFAMVYEGAKGYTAEEIKTVFGFPDQKQAMRSSFASIYNDINKEDKEYMLSTANALFSEKTHALLNDYMKVIESYYGGKTTNMDFKNKADESRIAINKWIEEKTYEKIKDMLQRGSINDMTKLIIANAIYFKGDWDLEFDSKLTYYGDFYLKSGDVIKVDMMNQTGEDYSYTKTDSLKAIELPYKGNDVSMLVILPNKGKLDEVEDTFSQELVTNLIGKMYKQKVDLFLPKFKMEAEYDLKSHLLNMGMPTVFGSSADLSLMDGSDDLEITGAFHKAFIEVNEEGTEAAAATAILVGTTSMVIQEEFKADRPFIFVILQKQTGNILFMGKVSNPAI